MEPTIVIRFPALSDPDAKADIETFSDNIAATIKTTTIVHYTQTVVSLNVPTKTRASVQIAETGFYLLVMVSGHLMMERTGAKPIPMQQSPQYCQALYLYEGEYYISLEPGKHRVVCYAFASDWIQRIKHALPVINEVSTAIKPPMKALIFPHTKLPEPLADHLLSLAYESAETTAAAQLDHFHTLNNIISYYDTLLANALNRNAAKRNYHEIVNDFIDYCNRSMLHQKVLSVEEVAAAIHVSSKTLSRALRHVLNNTVTPGQLLLNMRMKTAYKLLVRENHQVQQVAHLLGYSDTSAFSKIYRKVMGHLPSEAVTVQKTPDLLSGTP